MRKLTYEELICIQNEHDLLNGCINRMCTTDNLEEFEILSKSATSRIKLINALCLKRFWEDC